MFPFWESFGTVSVLKLMKSGVGSGRQPELTATGDYTHFDWKQSMQGATDFCVATYPLCLKGHD